MLAQLSTLLLELHCGCHELCVTEFQDWAFNLVRNYIAFDFGFWGTGAKYEESAVVHSNHFYQLPKDELLLEWREAGLAESAEYARMTAEAGSAINFTHAELTASPGAAEIYSRHELNNALGAYFLAPESALYSVVLFGRRDPGHVFSEDEREFTECLMPHLIETLRINQLKHLTKDSKDQPFRVYSTIADRNAIVHITDPHFIQLLQSEWPGWHPPHLPDKLAAHLSALRPYQGRNIHISFSEINELVMLHARNKIKFDELSEREREVARYSGSGFSHKEIAQFLDLSPHTVNNQLAAIYRKLGINSKAALINYMRELRCDAG